MRITHAALALLLAGNGIAEASEKIKTHGLWESRMIEVEGSPQYRALTLQGGQDYATILTLDRLPGACDTQYISINVVTSNEHTNAFEAETTFGFMRIDNKPVHNVKARIRGGEGESVSFVRILEFDGSDRLLQELVGGRAITFKLRFEQTDLDFAFSLMGFTAAQTRSYVLCENNGKEPLPKPRPAPTPAPLPETNPF